jgi:hypothetical protein
MKFRYKINPGTQIPAFYGPVKLEYETNKTEVMLFPFNVVFAILGFVWANLRRLHVAVYQDTRVAYNQGVKDGRKQK